MSFWVSDDPQYPQMGCGCNRAWKRTRQGKFLNQPLGHEAAAFRKTSTSRTYSAASILFLLPPLTSRRSSTGLRNAPV
jgi:hypothetical protein